MENASKALIIAGAILLSILIISLGIMVYNNAKDTVGNANLDSTEISTFNSQWEAYVGSNQTAAQCKTLVAAAVASNASEKNAGTNRNVKIGGKDPATINTATAYNSSQTYTISVSYNNGLVDNITIKSN